MAKNTLLRTRGKNANYAAGYADGLRCYPTADHHAAAAQDGYAARAAEFDLTDAQAYHQGVAAAARRTH